MGKSQTKKKTQARRHNPMRVPDAHLGAGKVDGKADPVKAEQMLPVLRKLRSAEYADRTWACAAVCNLIQNDAATRRLFQSKNVVGELIERLSDSVDEVVVEASGALRNLAIDGGHELCGEMFNKGVMAHLKVLMGKISTTIDSILASRPDQPQETKRTEAEIQARKHLLSLSENVISLVWCLAEANHKTLAAVNAANVEGLLVKAIEGRNVVGPGVALAAAQAMYSLSQDNQPFARSVMYHPTAVPAIVAAIQEDHSGVEAEAARRSAKGKSTAEANGHAEQELPDGRALLMRVCLAGVIRNVVPPNSPAEEAIGLRQLTNDVILPLVNSLLDVDLRAMAARAEQLAGQMADEAGKLKTQKDIMSDHRSPAEQSLERLERMLSTIVIGLEVLTGICAGVEDVDEEVPAEGEGDDLAKAEDEDEDILADEDDASMDGASVVGGAGEDEDSDDDVLAEAAAHADMLAEGGDASLPAARISDAVSLTLPHLLSISIPERLAKLATLTPLSFPPSTPGQPSVHPPTTAVLSTLHLRALEALNNLLLTIVASLPPMLTPAAAQLVGSVPSQGIWNVLGGVVQLIAAEPEAVRVKGQEMRGEVLGMAVGGMWGVVRIGGDQIAIPSEHIQLLLSLPSCLSSPLARSRLIDLLSALASRQNISNDENQIISQFILSSLGSTLQANPIDTESTIALLNAMIDIYADEDRAYDVVFQRGGYLEQLSQAVGPVKAMVKKVDRRTERELRLRAEEVSENLQGFVRYRKSLRR